MKITKINDDLDVAKTRLIRALDLSLSDNTKRGYLSDWTIFTAWCDEHDFTPYPASEKTVCLFLSYIWPSRRKSSCMRYLAAIHRVHLDGGLASPIGDLTKQTLKGLARGRAEPRSSATPLLWEDILKILEILTPSAIDRRDGAILCLGWACACRRSEISALQNTDIKNTEAGFEVYIKPGKTPVSRLVGIPRVSWLYRYIDRWYTFAEMEQNPGPLFFSLTKAARGFWWPGRNSRRSAISPASVSAIISRLAARAQLSGSFSGHSLRRGYVTECSRLGVPSRLIRAVTGHRSDAGLDPYIASSRIWEDSPLRLFQSPLS